MTEQEAIEVLRKHKEIIDKEYFKARNSKAIEVVLNALEEKDKIIDLMSEQLTTPIHSKEWVKEYYERKVKEKE